MNIKSALVAVAAVALGASAASAAPILLDLDPATAYQQQAQSPCVIGAPSCSNPPGFAKTTLAANTATNTNIASPLYTVAQIRAIVGDTFSIGIDVNSNSQPMATEFLDSFSLAINGTTQFLFNTSTQLQTNNNGSGFSDALLTGFDLSTFLNTDTARFFTTFPGATAGRESFFLVAAPAEVTDVLEPGTLAVLGLGLLATGFIRRRKTNATRA